MIDLLAFAVIVGMTLLGRRRGLAGMALTAGGLLGGYLAALLLFRPVGRVIESVSGLPGLVAYPLAGMAVLMVVSAAMNVLAKRHRRDRTAKMSDGWEPPSRDAVGGMVLGAAYGLAIAVVLSWAGMSLGSLYAHTDVGAMRSSITGRISTGTTRRAIALGARAIVGDRFVAGSVGRMVADPGRAIQSLNGVMQDPRMQSLLGSGVLQEAARMQDPSVLANNAALRELASDERFAEAMRTFGLAGGGSGAVDPTEVADAIVAQAGPALRSVGALVDDPEIRQILEAPAFRQAWDDGDFLHLARAPDFQRLFDRALSELRQGS